MFLRILVVLFWIFTLLQPASAQTWRRRNTGLSRATATEADKVPASDPAVPPTNDSDGAGATSRRPEAHGWVWVSRTIDLAQQLGGEDKIMTLDGEPLPAMRKPSVTLGLVIDDENHIVTRLVGATPDNPPTDITVRAQGGRPAPAKFLGMDAVTGLCVLQAEGASLTAPVFSNLPALPRQLSIRLYGFHPKINQNTSVITSLYPRCNFYPGQIVKAVEDFRFNSRNPIYYLLTPQMTLAQDCSLILDEDDTVFGVAIYNIGGDGNHLVYPVSRLQTIARSVIESHASIAYGWLGATGQDAPMSALPHVRSSQSPGAPGVRILNIAPDSPAELAGVKPHDVVVAVNARRISTYAQMVSLMKQISPDNEVSLRVKRGNEYKLLKAKLVSAPAIEPEQQFVVFNRKINDIEKELNSLAPTDPNRSHLEHRKDAWRKFVNGLVDGIWNQAPLDVRLRVLYGFEIQTLTDQLMSYFAAPNGMLVSNVTEGAGAARSGLQAGDVIVEAGAKPINRLADLIDALDSASGSPIEITLMRRGERLKITFQR
ncbi:MAG: PDZ domain-containing protein [Blastocatellia bacterium]|nr:PDZ domain-containing protein [Blastocatellia bacterium]